MSKRIVTTIQITNDLVLRALTKVIKHENKQTHDAIMLLLNDMLCQSPKGAEWFMRFMVGEKTPFIPATGSEVYADIQKLGWGVDKEAYKASVHNENGFIRCEVREFDGLHSYAPVRVYLPPLDATEIDKEYRPHCSLNVDDIMPVDSKDFYEQ